MSTMLPEARRPPIRPGEISGVPGQEPPTGLRTSVGIGYGKTAGGFLGVAVVIGATVAAINWIARPGDDEGAP